MKQTQTKHAAEAVLRELPSVIGACVHEDVTGRPREVHLLVRPVPSVRDLAQDVRDLLEERLGMPIDQRIISIAQIAADKAGVGLLDRNDSDDERGPASTTGPSAQAGHGSEPLAPQEPPTATTSRPTESVPPRPRPKPPSTGVAHARATGPAGEEEPPARPPTTELASVGPSRLVFEGLETHARETRVSVRVRLSWRGREFVGESSEVDAGQGRARAAAGAVVRAAAAACRHSVRFELEAASVSRAMERDYALVSVLAMTPWLGRQPVTLVGAHPVEGDVQTAAALAVLKATNRVVERSLEAEARAQEERSG